LDAMRERNPCLFALLRRLGWYVRFIEIFSEVYSCSGPR
jgi:hypothetical protein